jgi:hypothetical protein
MKDQLPEYENKEPIFAESWEKLDPKYLDKLIRTLQSDIEVS